MFGQELYIRKNPLVSESKEFISESKVYFKDFPVLYTFHYGDTSEVENPSDFFDYFVESFHVDSQSKLTVKKNYTLTRCQHDFFTSNKEIIKDLISKTPFQYYCFNNSNYDYFSNEMGSPSSVYFRFLVELCDINNPSRNCKITPRSILYI